MLSSISFLPKQWKNNCSVPVHAEVTLLVNFAPPTSPTVTVSASRLQMIYGALPYWMTIGVNQIQKDRYSRTVAEIFLGETFINAEMVRTGHAWHYKRYSGNCPNRSAIAQAAKGVQLTGMPPWEFRKGN